MNKSPFSHLSEHQAEHRLMNSRGYGEIPSMLWANKPIPTKFGKGLAIFSDIGEAPGLMGYCDGTTWIFPSARLANAPIPIILPSSGSIANNGALTLTVALDVIYPDCYMYFPANSIFAGQVANFFYVSMSSTTLGTIYNNYPSSITGWIPTIPATPTPIVATGPGAYTQTENTEITAFAVPIVGGVLGINGCVDMNFNICGTSTAQTKTINAKYNNVYVGGIVTTTSIFSERVIKMSNCGKANRQVTEYAQSGATTSPINTYTAINSAATANLILILKLAAGSAGTDWCGIARAQFDITPGN